MQGSQSAVAARGGEFSKQPEREEILLALAERDTTLRQIVGR